MSFVGLDSVARSEMNRFKEELINSSAGVLSKVRLMVGIPVLTTFFVLALGLMVIKISNRTLMASPEMTVAEVEESIREIVNAVVVMAVAALAAGSALAFALTRPMKELAEKADKIACGDLAGGTEPMAIRGAPEFVALGDAFNSMVESLNRTFVNGVNCGVLMVDAGERVTFANQNAANLLGLGFGDLAGCGLRECLRGSEGAEEIFAAVRETLALKKPVAGREVCVRQTIGGRAQLRVSTALFRDADSRNVGVTVWLEDVTSLKSLRRDLKKLERLITLAAFVEGIAHQVRNPLCSIRGHAQLIKERGGAHTAELPDGIINNVDIIDSVIRSFLEAPRRDDLSESDAELAERELREALFPRMKKGA